MKNIHQNEQVGVENSPIARAPVTRIIPKADSDYHSLLRFPGMITEIGHE
jgi:hypothetical protein